MCHEDSGLIQRDSPLAALCQHDPSTDCGYFAGWALKILHRSSAQALARAAGPGTSRLQVYEARENALPGAPTRVLTHRHNSDLPPGNAATFLTNRQTGLGLPRYARRQFSNVIDHNQPFDGMLRFLPPSGNFGILYAFSSGSGPGHWMAILGKRPRGLLVYDSSGFGHRHLGWCDPAEFNRLYGGRHATSQCLIATVGDVA